MYLLDTDILSNLLDASRNYPQLHKRILSTDAALVFISVISIEELLKRILPRIQDDRNTPRIVERYEALKQFIRQMNEFQILNFDEPALEIYARVPGSIRQHHSNDSRIAAIAISRGYTVVTRNTRHFEKIPDVQFEDWMLTPLEEVE